MKRSTLEWAPFFRGLSIISIIRKRQAEKEAENKMFVYVLYSHLLFQVKFAGEHHKPPFLFSGFSNHTDRMVFKKPFLGLDMTAGTTSFAGTAMKVSWGCYKYSVLYSNVAIFMNYITTVSDDKTPVNLFPVSSLTLLTILKS